MENDRTCPECGSALGRYARYCGCGWGKPKKGERQPDLPRVECCFAGCIHLAKVKLKTPTGWANMCAGHYEEFTLKRALETCKRLGLTSVPQMKAWVRQEKKKGIARDVPLREPGEDSDADVYGVAA